MGELLHSLSDPELQRWERVERRILSEWSRSGSPAMDLLLQRGRAALDAGEIDAALDHLTALTDHAPDFAEGWNARAAAFYERGDYGPAMEDLGRALALNPSHFGALSGLGLILEETGRKAQALEVFRAARAIHPHQPVISRSVERLEAQISGRET
ncbi:MAG: tetratricopeptide repeat protein [Alkalilacustris sp.]